MRIGLISDTHLPQLIHSLDDLGPEAGEALQGADLILHGGDITVPAVLDWCEQFAPVLAVRGNNDIFEDPRMAELQFMEAEGARIGMAHELRPETRPIGEILASSLGGERVDILIGGDTHVERIEYRDGVLLVNPGSPTLPHHLSMRWGSIGILTLEPDRWEAEIVALGPSDGLRNPAVAQRVVIERGAVTAASRAGAALTPEDFLRPPHERAALAAAGGAGT